MAVSIVNYTGDGSTSQYIITFDYIDRTHVSATVNGSASAFTFINDTTIQFATAPASGAAVKLLRQTPVAALVDFTDGSTLFEADLDLAHRQNRLLAVESRDRADNAITTLNNNINNIDTVAASDTAINTVATNVANVNNVSTNMAEVLLADTNAVIATTKAGEASVDASTSSQQAAISTTKAGEAASSAAAAVSSASSAASSQSSATASASAASTSESNASASATSATSSASTASTGASTATTKASEAATSATNAATSATESETAKDAAETARDATLAALDSFDDRYLGVKANAPTVDNDGNALIVGALYFNTGTDKLYIWNGTAWQITTSGAAAGDLISTNNLSDVTSAPTSRTNLGLVTVASTGSYSDLTGTPTLGTAAATASTDYATAAQGTLAASAQQPPSEGAFVNGDKTKLNGIEASADVTDTANVTSAGALMDSEVTNLAQVKAFDSADYATAAQGTLAASAVQPNDSPTFGTVNATTVDLGNWTVTESSGVLHFATGGVNKMKLDATGNLTVVGNVTAYGTI